MAKIDTVRAEMMKALKERNMDRKNALSMLLSALKAKKIDKREELTPEEENAVVLKEIKELQETMEAAPSERADIRGECRYKIGVYQEFAPQQMGENEIRAAVKDVLYGLGIATPTPQNKGAVMKALMPAVKGKADGSLVNRIVSEMLKA